MAILVNKMNREVKVIIPNMREFRTFYSDSEGVIGMFFKRDWEEDTTKKEEHWRPEGQQLDCLRHMINVSTIEKFDKQIVRGLYEQLKLL